MSTNNFAEEEERVLEMWKKKGIFDLVQKKESPEGDFVFYEGPPTANAKPALHHVLARVFKDVIPRYKAMQGFHIDRKAGWDTHGLPVELQVEKKLGISGKPQIENIVPGDAVESIKKFNAECKDMVWGFLDEWTRLTERIGFWLDLKDPYVTYENQYIESLWWVFKQMWDKGLVYQSHKVVPYCNRCGTALSSHEVAQGYQTVKDRSVFVKFPVPRGVQGKPTYILSWTTTPWTLPGNVALAVGENVDYVYVDTGDETLILAKNRLEILEGEYKVVKEVKGSKLVGFSYEPLFDVNSLKSDTSYKVYVADFVTDVDGTGVVHTAVMYGEDDYVLGESLGLPKFHTVDGEGNFVDEVSGLAGKYVKDKETEQGVIDHLTQNNLLFGEEMYEHEYPFCWRCKTPLLYYARDSWFVRVTDVKDRLVANNQTINWEPSHIKDGRFGEWLNNIRDWAISRERYWGTPLPIWVCECGEIRCVGSASELGVEVELHRPYVDEVELDCEKCDKKMKRVPEVMDVWFDSGSMPIAQFGFPHKEGSEDELNNHYPADYISEGIDQTRGWFYTLLSVATLLEKEAPYKNVICLGHILDGKGFKMSKSKGNVVEPWEVINTHGVDALRWHFFSMSAAGEPKRFDMKGVDQAKRRTLMIVWNVVKFYELYKDNATGKMADTALDRWVLSRLAETTQTVAGYLDNYDVTRATRALHDFITEVSTWYVRRSRGRFKSGEAGVVDVLRHVLLETAKLMAPFTPFIAERVYGAVGGPEPQGYQGKESVHLESWPEVGNVEEELLKAMQQTRDVVEMGMRLRAENSMKVRQPLSAIAVDGVKLDEEYVEILKEELNVKAVEFTKNDWPSHEDKGMTVGLNIALNDELKLEGVARELVRTINGMRKDAGLTITDRISLVVSESGKTVFDAHEEYILTSTKSDSVEFGDGGEVEVGDIAISIKK